MSNPSLDTFKKRIDGYYVLVFSSTLLDGTNVRLNWNIESDMNVYWIKFKIFLSLYCFKNKQYSI